MRRVGFGLVGLALMAAVLWVAGAFASESATKLCVPEKEGKPVVSTNSAGSCKAK